MFPRGVGGMSFIDPPSGFQRNSIKGNGDFLTDPLNFCHILLFPFSLSPLQEVKCTLAVPQ